MKEIKNNYSVENRPFKSLAEAEDWIRRTIGNDFGFILKKNNVSVAIYSKKNGALIKHGFSER